MMGTMKYSKYQALVVGDSKVNSKDKKKAKKPPDKKGDESSNSKKKNFQKNKGKGKGSKCAYCSKDFHPEISCMKK